MQLLLISNSTNAGEEYLDYPKFEIKKFLGKKPCKALFIPYAGVTISYDDYTAKVKERFEEVGHTIESIHKFSNPIEAVKNANAIVIGGGNTFQLTKLLQDNGLIDVIRNKVMNNTPYIGWSAGSNVASPTIRTTNDMPVVEPKSFAALNIISFQINPHYLDANPDGHAGETREMRIDEFTKLNPDVYVIGLREGTILKITDNNIDLIGNKSARIFFNENIPTELNPGDDFNFLLKNYSEIN